MTNYKTGKIELLSQYRCWKTEFCKFNPVCRRPSCFGQREYGKRPVRQLFGADAELTAESAGATAE